MDYKKLIRDVPDFPKPGILFKDLTTLWKDGKAFGAAMKDMARGWKGKRIDKVVGVESRGFIIGAALSLILGCGFVPVRKKGKLPAETISETYELEYGTDTLFMHKDAVGPGETVLIADDLIATGGTCAAACRMVEKQGAKVAGFAFLTELSFLKGREKIKGYEVRSLIQY
jgi:adenine phosphoribosyltransferase